MYLLVQDQSRDDIGDEAGEGDDAFDDTVDPEGDLVQGLDVVLGEHRTLQGRPQVPLHSLVPEGVGVVVVEEGRVVVQLQHAEVALEQPAIHRAFCLEHHDFS